MQRIQKNRIGYAGMILVQSLFLREGITCETAEGIIDLEVQLTKPKRKFGVLVVTNLRPKKAGGKGKEALDWWIPIKNEADFIVCVDLSTLRVWIFGAAEMSRFAQQRSKNKLHFYMYTDNAVALRGKKASKFDYEFESYRLENRIYRGVFDRK
ncbi:MAG TPA: hypothetical protein VMX58_05870 [Patescibacteria group bacterium]|nr:hypothetical protein [Patescibacteria group bacterium]